MFNIAIASSPIHIPIRQFLSIPYNIFSSHWFNVRDNFHISNFPNNNNNNE